VTNLKSDAFSDALTQKVQMSEVFETAKAELEVKIQFIEGGGWTEGFNLRDMWCGATDVVDDYEAHVSRMITNATELKEVVVKYSELTQLLRNLYDAILKDSRDVSYKTDYLWSRRESGYMELNCQMSEYLSCFLKAVLRESENVPP
jgi:hypothetical protein